MGIELSQCADRLWSFSHVIRCMRMCPAMPSSPGKLNQRWGMSCPQTCTLQSEYCVLSNYVRFMIRGPLQEFGSLTSVNYFCWTSITIFGGWCSGVVLYHVRKFEPVSSCCSLYIEDSHVHFVVHKDAPHLDSSTS